YNNTFLVYQILIIKKIFLEIKKRGQIAFI
ncbi:MAG: hypothetical protein PWP02_414, partial [Thermosipho sp. (in: thermotogales)]|nr:hypothetical protein [Thermosipho sp. (in: thermotogales)]